jgi:general nucleoside transport system permease protein
MINLISWIASSVVFASIIMMGALGETLTEKSGHLNLGVPGIMYISGFLSYYAAYCYENSTDSPNGFLVAIIALGVAFLVGASFGLLYAVMCVSFKCNQNVMGLLITSFAVGFAKFISFAVGIETSSKASFSGQVFNATIPGLSSIPYLGTLLFGYGFMVYLTIALAIVMDLYFKKVRSGLNLRAVGESPASADAVGIDVNRYKYVATMIGCGIVGLAGTIYVLGFGNGLWSTNNNIEAIGWLAVALVIFALWHPIRLIWGSIIFGILFWAYNYLPTLISLPAVTGLVELLKILPYLVTLIVLIVNSARHKKENQPPSSLGTNYYREER